MSANAAHSSAGEAQGHLLRGGTTSDSSSGSMGSQNRPARPTSYSRGVPVRLGKPGNAPRAGKLPGLPSTAGGLSVCKGITEGDVW